MLDSGPLVAGAPPAPVAEPLLWCFFLVLWVVLPEPPLPLDAFPALRSIPVEPVEPLEPVLPAAPELDPVLPIAPDPLVVESPDCANAAPAASIEMTATRFHQVLFICKRSV